MTFLSWRDQIHFQIQSCTRKKSTMDRSYGTFSSAHRAVFSAAAREHSNCVMVYLIPAFK